jgi:hypothetical protein
MDPVERKQFIRALRDLHSADIFDQLTELERQMRIIDEKRRLAGEAYVEAMRSETLRLTTSTKSEQRLPASVAVRSTPTERVDRVATSSSARLRAPISDNSHFELAGANGGSATLDLADADAGGASSSVIKWKRFKLSDDEDDIEKEDKRNGDEAEEDDDTEPESSKRGRSKHQGRKEKAHQRGILSARSSKGKSPRSDERSPSNKRKKQAKESESSDDGEYTEGSSEERSISATKISRPRKQQLSKQILDRRTAHRKAHTALVKQFLMENRNFIRGLYKQQPMRTKNSPGFMEGYFDGRRWTLTPEQKDYLSCPGVIGMSRHNKQRYYLRFHQVDITPNLLGKPLVRTQFEDPRDIRDVVNKLQPVFEQFKEANFVFDEEEEKDEDGDGHTEDEPIKPDEMKHALKSLPISAVIDGLISAEAVSETPQND